MSEFHYRTLIYNRGEEDIEVEVCFSGDNYPNYPYLRHLGEWSYKDKDEIRSLVALGVVVATLRDGRIKPRKSSGEYYVFIPYDVPKDILQIIEKIMGRIK